MGMADGLPPLDSCVGHQTMPRGSHPLLGRDEGGKRQQLPRQSRIGLGHGRYIVVVLGGNDEDVDGRLRVDVPKGKGLIAARDNIRRDVSR